MFSDDQIRTFRKCPRCEDHAYECFKTHSYCASCNFSTVSQSELVVIPRWATKALNDRNDSEKKSATYSNRSGSMALALTS